MSTARTGQALADRMASAGLTVERLPVLRDVDTAQDAAEVAALAPEGRFADCWRSLGSRVGAAR
jgi:glycosyltransferase A (GT-A) superfamily protein (DUF2064 family)